MQMCQRCHGDFDPARNDELACVFPRDKVYIHSYPDKKTACTRFYIHAGNIAAAVMFLLSNGALAKKYNITGESKGEHLKL